MLLDIIIMDKAILYAIRYSFLTRINHKLFLKIFIFNNTTILGRSFSLIET